MKRRDCPTSYFLPTAGFWCMALLCLGALACTTPRSGASDPTNARAIEIWQGHEAAVERALEANQKDDEFPDACAFFERVAGIGIDANMFTLGFAPTPKTEADLKRVRDWFRDNKTRLYWDDSAGEVRVRPSV